MTNPSWYTPIEPSQGVYSPLAYREREQFFSELARYSPGILGEIGLQTSPSTQRPPTQVAQQEPTATLPDATLVGRAMYWGIPEESARMLPRETLVALVEDAERRYSAPMALGTNDLGSRFVLGGAQALTGILKHIPFIGEQIERTELIQRADMWLGQFEEAARVSKTQEGLQGFAQSAAPVAGAIGAFIIPGNAAWNLAGTLGKIIPATGALASPVVRIAAQSGASAWMLEGRGIDQTLSKFVTGDATQQDLEQLIRSGITVGVGAGAGAAIGGLVQYTPAVQELASKMGKAFGGSWQQRVAQAGTPVTPTAPSSWEIPLSPNRQVSVEDDLARVISDPNMPAESRESAQAVLNEISAMNRRSRVSVPDMMIPVREADAAATQMSKQQILGESSIAPNIMWQTLPDETVVAAAQIVDNPGGVNIVPGIPDPAKFMETLVPSGQRVTFARRPNSTTLDAIISDEPISNILVNQYEKNGLFQGQRVLTSDGIPSRIVSWADDFVEIKSVYGGITRTVPRNSVMPSPSSSGVMEVPQMWNYFKEYANDRTVESQF